MRNRWWQYPVALVMATIVSTSPAMGQSMQTWVSTTGTPYTNCSRENPCRTFFQALQNTTAGGQIQVLDSGEFGWLVIDKSITIKAEGVLGSIIATIDGLTINARSDARVVIDGLDIDGGREGTFGIRIFKAGEVVVRNTTIRNFLSAGISVYPYLEPVSINLTVDNVLIHHADRGIWVHTPAGSRSTVYVWNSKIIETNLGITAAGMKTRVEISGNVINRTPKSLDIQPGAVIASYGDNILSAGDAPSSVSKN